VDARGGSDSDRWPRISAARFGGPGLWARPCMSNPAARDRSWDSRIRQQSAANDRDKRDGWDTRRGLATERKFGSPMPFKPMVQGSNPCAGTRMLAAPGAQWPGISWSGPVTHSTRISRAPVGQSALRQRRSAPRPPSHWRSTSSPPAANRSASASSSGTMSRYCASSPSVQSTNSVQIHAKRWPHAAQRRSWTMKCESSTRPLSMPRWSPAQSGPASSLR
jgi:hypothetical protein